MKKTAWQVLFEFLSIVFAVLLALGLNTFKQNMDQKNESELLRDKIIAECKQNLSRLDSAIMENSAMLDYLDSLATLEEIDELNVEMNTQLLTSSAWTFTQSSQSYHYMDTDFLDEATEMYEIQRYYTQMSSRLFEKFGDMLLKVNELETEDFINTIRYYLSNLLNASRELQEYYNYFVEEYETEAKTED